MILSTYTRSALRASPVPIHPDMYEGKNAAMKKPIYNVICQETLNGILPDDFSLSDSTTSLNSFTPGAREGKRLVLLERGQNLTEKQTVLIRRMVSNALSGQTAAAEELAMQIGDEIDFADTYEAVVRAVSESTREQPDQPLADFARALARYSPHPGAIKLSLLIQSLYPQKDGAAREVVRTLGLSPELTLYAALAMKHWQQRNDERFALARKVRGWPRICLVFLLEPETEEIRRWLLTEGIDNGIHPAWSAPECFEKTNVHLLVAGNLTADDFTPVCRLLIGLLDARKIRGIRLTDTQEQTIRLFLEKAEGMDLDNAAEPLRRRLNGEPEPADEEEPEPDIAEETEEEPEKEPDSAHKAETPYRDTMEDQDCPAGLAAAGADVLRRDIPDTEHDQPEHDLGTLPSPACPEPRTGPDSLISKQPDPQTETSPERLFILQMIEQNPAFLKAYERGIQRRETVLRNADLAHLQNIRTYWRKAIVRWIIIHVQEDRIIQQAYEKLSAAEAVDTYDPFHWDAYDFYAENANRPKQYYRLSLNIDPSSCCEMIEFLTLYSYSVWPLDAILKRIITACSKTVIK